MFDIHDFIESYEIQPVTTGYFVVLASTDGIYANDFHVIDEYEAAKTALSHCPSDWTGLVTVDQNYKFDPSNDPILQFEVE